MRMKNDGSRKIRLPVRKIFGFLGMEAVLLCVSFFMPAFAEKLPSEERKLQVEKTLSGEETSPAEKKREEKETLTYESPIFTGGERNFYRKRQGPRAKKNTVWYQRESETQRKQEK